MCGFSISCKQTKARSKYSKWMRIFAAYEPTFDQCSFTFLYPHYLHAHFYAHQILTHCSTKSEKKKKKKSMVHKPSNFNVFRWRNRIIWLSWFFFSQPWRELSIQLSHNDRNASKWAPQAGLHIHNMWSCWRENIVLKMNQ